MVMEEVVVTVTIEVMEILYMLRTLLLVYTEKRNSIDMNLTTIKSKCKIKN